MAQFRVALSYTLPYEGGYSDRQTDRGGKTNYGITLKTLRRYGLTYDFNHDGDVNDLDLRLLDADKVEDFYLSNFWSYGTVNSQAVANYLFDMSVNHSPHKAIELTQRAINAYLSTMSLKEDGILGIKTLNEINKIDIELMASLRATRIGYYRAIIAGDGSQLENLNGWIKRALSMPL